LVNKGSGQRKVADIIVRADGSVEHLGHIGKTDMAVGDVFIIETPGGGGYGSTGGR
jgi:5-oxoprolinase (ATP-hydrolysing)